MTSILETDQMRRMSLIMVLAWRNIWRNQRRSWITMSAIGIGLLLVIFYSGLVSGFVGDAKNQLDNGGLGHIEIFPKGYRQHHLSSLTMIDPSAWVDSLSIPPESETSTRVLARGLASSARGSEAVEVYGVDFRDEQRVSAHLNNLSAGALPTSEDVRGIVVGDVLASRLKLKIGSKVRLMLQRVDQEIGADLFRVRAIFHSIVPTIGRRQVLISPQAARELLGLHEGSHQVVIQLADPNLSDEVARKSQSTLGNAYEVLSYGQLLPVLYRMERLINNAVLAVAFFIYLLVALGILNTVLISVLERTREFGVLMSVGTRPRDVVALVLAESFLMATVAVVVGGGIGGFLTWYFSQYGFAIFAFAESFSFEGLNISTLFKTRFVLTDIAKASAYVYVMALLVGLYPALRVSRLQPAEALRRT